MRGPTASDPVAGLCHALPVVQLRHASPLNVFTHGLECTGSHNRSTLAKGIEPAQFGSPLLCYGRWTNRGQPKLVEPRWLRGIDVEGVADVVGVVVAGYGGANGVGGANVSVDVAVEAGLPTLMVVSTF